MYKCAKLGVLALLLMVWTQVGSAQTPQTCTGNIQITNNTNNTSLGFVSNVWNAFGEYVPTTDPTHKLVVGFTPGALFSMTAVNGQDNTVPFVGAIKGFSSTSPDLGAGSFNYTTLGGTVSTPANSPPVAGTNSFTNATMIAEPIESDIWSISGNLVLTAQWVNTNSSKPKIFDMLSTSQGNVLTLTGDATAFINAFGAADSVTWTFVPTSTCSLTAPVLSVTKSHFGTFTQGGTGEWDILVTNAAGSLATMGTTTVSDTLPTGYTVNSFSTTDSSWSCSGTGTQTATCTNSSAINGASNFPVIQVIVNIPATSPQGVSNTAKAFGGGDPTHTNLATAATGFDGVTVVQVPAFVTATGGTPQSTAINTPFPAPLQVTVQDAGHVVIPNVAVAFLSPGSGPTGTFGAPCGGPTCVVLTNASGGATAPTFTANGTAGTYQVLANVTGTTLLPAQFALTNVAPPSITKSFSPTLIPVNGTSVLTITITNPSANPVALSGLAFTDNLPANLTIASPISLNNSCGGTANATSPPGVITLTGGSVQPHSSCSLSTNVTSTVAATYQNTITTVGSTNGGAGGPSNTATLQVVRPPSITKTFGAPSVPLGGTTSLSFNITNPNTNAQLTSVGFTAADVLQAGLIVASPANVNNTCGGTATVVAASSSVNLTGVTLAGGASCTLSLNVTGTTPGAKTNTVQVSSGTIIGNTATATLNVFGPPTITKAFSPTVIPLGGITTVTFTIGNPNTTALTGVAFSDNLPTALVVATPPNVNNTCGGTVTAAAGTSLISLSAGTVTTSCTLSVDLKGISPGIANNTTGPVTSNEGGTGTASNTATVDIVGPPTFTKTIATPAGAGFINLVDTTSVIFTVTNPNSVSLSGLAFTDVLPAGLLIQNPNGLANSCGGTVTATPGTGTISLTGGTVSGTSTCTISVNVTAFASGTLINPSITLTSNEAPPTTSSPASVYVDPSFWLWFFY
jgi:uncharacterized repeat protein (TIGR01451 family)